MTVNDDDLMHRVCDTVHGYLEVGNEVFEANGARFVRNRSCPRRYDANHVAHVQCAVTTEIARLLQRVESEFAEFRHRRFEVNPFTPQQFVARLTIDDYTFSETLQMVLHGELQARPRAVDIRLVHSEPEWLAYGELVALEWDERTHQSERAPDPDTLADFMTNKRCQSPAIRHWLAYEEGVACAYFSSWPGRNGVGIVEDLFTVPARRHRGIATALIVHAVADARARGAGPIVIGARVDDTPKHLYAAMGFEPLLLTRQYLRVASST
ncbi:MAG: GNAT family N-acetyltransferase [Deltaproteobacteria bacterium]|nr:GNAT family N-acetyltransferase [Deltaproteobacteria bacterium]MBI3391143.1 GNAT family N-acetyltransferase [Deltaproteobacteria bacterium]